jgi:GT2 family glycosyltransferase
VSAGNVTVLVIPTFNARRRLPLCLASLEWRHDANLTVVVVDAGSTDGTREWLRREAPDVELVCGSPWMWWTGLVDLGCRYAIDALAADRLALLNDDCLWDHAGFEALSELIDASPRMIVCSQVRDRESGLPIFTGGLVDRSGRFVARALPDGGSNPASRQVVWSGGQGVLFSTEVFSTIGGFDPVAFPHYCGDLDFCLRARRRGIPTFYCAESVVLNDTSSTGVTIRREGTDFGTVARSLLSRRSPYYVRDNLRLYLRHGGVRAPLGLAHLYFIWAGSSLMRLLRGAGAWPR